ncbi:MAG: YceI family protein [Crocinitomicaceae bacterium]|nr:YceI family protein [Crocinitomicaceae bacterium]MDP4866827.1 YceI family protein [Crocinitomicaceae bacterium]
MGFASCGSSENEAEKVEKVSYKLDAATSSLKWKGSKSAEYFHEGTVSITDGSIEMEGDALVAGSFTIDLNTIANTDAMLPEDKKAMLVGHLMAEDFFNTAKNAIVKVTLNGYENGKLSATINVLGQDIKQDLDAKLVADENGASIVGKFDVDFASLNMAGMQADPTTGEKIQSAIAFDLNVQLKK